MQKIIPSRLTQVGRRFISGVSPTLYLRSQKLSPKQDAYDQKRAALYGLVRFTTHHLTTLSEDDPKKSIVQADLERYKALLAQGVEELTKKVSDEVNQQLQIIAKLDRYPDVTFDQVKSFAETLSKKWASVSETLSKDYIEPQEFNWEYFNTSRFPLIEINSGKVVLLPDGPVPPGAVELLPWQCIKTKVNGEDVVIEIEDYDENSMALWFKPEIPVPAEAEVLWEYSDNQTSWDIDNQKLITSGEEVKPTSTFTELVAPEPEAVAQPQKRTFLDSFTVHIEKLNKIKENQTQVSQALLNPSEAFNLEEEYSSHYDREIIESKRGRYFSAIKDLLHLKYPLEVDPIKVKLENTITKGQLVDLLRQQEYYIGEETLLARLHARRLEGEIIVPDEELDYKPHVRDDTELAMDYGDPITGRYLWKLFPHLDLDEEALLNDRRFESLPAEQDPLNKILENHEKSLSLHQKLERKLLNAIRLEVSASEVQKLALE
eukprot:NODE_2373_length_1600_cov_117.040623_g2040_i0.p1 GENE.NODE_2373_length_1600_cov_117.040623_g2040_i0~~NODE_2373_length_1600_cov_117.040623_g2040_i0.p1  ORF type:complete len:490 (-),score=93.70 NODE_2373_length_1600_cov_117.040623_g2040_i0:68-1537(-)